MGDFVSAWRLLEGRLQKATERYGEKHPMVRKSIDLLFEERRVECGAA